MLIATIQIDAQPQDLQAEKEAIAAALERFGEVKVVSIIERLPEQMRIGEPE